MILIIEISSLLCSAIDLLYRDGCSAFDRRQAPQATNDLTDAWKKSSQQINNVVNSHKQVDLGLQSGRISQSIYLL